MLNGGGELGGGGGGGGGGAAENQILDFFWKIYGTAALPSLCKEHYQIQLSSQIILPQPTDCYGNDSHLEFLAIFKKRTSTNK